MGFYRIGFGILLGQFSVEQLSHLQNGLFEVNICSNSEVWFDLMMVL